MENQIKLPVLRTFANALGFAFGNYFTVLRLAWLPFTLLLATQLGLVWAIGLPAAGERVLNPTRVFEHLGDLFFLQIVMWILQLIVLAAIAVSIHRVILFGDRRPGVLFNFAFGRTEFVYAVMALLWALMIAAILLAVLAPVVLVLSGGDLAGLIARVEEIARNWPRSAEQVRVAFGPLMGVGAAYFIAWIVVLYVSLRLCLWPPSIVATNRLSPAEAWGLTRGNVLRLIGLFALTLFAAYLIVGVIAGMALFGAHDRLVELPPPPALLMDDPAAVRKHIAERIEALLPYWPVLWLIALLVYSFVVGLVVALISYSYKALKGYAAAAPIADGA